MKREKGLYFVKFNNWWTTASFMGRDEWYRFDTEYPTYENAFQEIKEDRIIEQHKGQCLLESGLETTVLELNEGRYPIFTFYPCETKLPNT